MRLLVRIVATLLVGLSVIAHAQSYPTKPIKVIVPYAVGQGTDIMARYLADEVSKLLGQPIFIDNRPGAGGNVGTQIAARSPADGYTLLVGTNATHAANGFLYSNTGFDPQADFEPIAMVGILPLVFVTSPSNSINSVTDMVRATRDKPGALNVAISTTTCRMAYELLHQQAKAQMFPVDFKGSAQALTAVIGNQVEYMVDTIASLRAPIANGQVKPLGVTSARSSRLLPGVKSVAELGVPDYELVGWTVVYAPKGVSPEASRALVGAFSKVLARSEVQEKLLEMGIDPVLKTGGDLKTYLTAEKKKWGELIQAAGLKPS
jgi:tripartite-type tricarboxylate transporter receptor subunit TctC